MTVEDAVTDELRTVARDVPVPPPPAASDLVATARHQRSRRRTRTVTATGLVAAAVAAAVVLGSQMGRPDASPRPTHPSSTRAALPTGSRPLVPYLIGETLYLSDEPVSGTWWDVQTVQGTTLATRAVPPMGKPVLFQDEKATHLLDHATGTARLSVEGTKLAWVEKTGSSAHLVVYDVRAGHELGRLAIDPRRVYTEDGTQEGIRWVGDDGTVWYGGSLGVRRWQPGSPATRSASGPPETQGYPVDETELAFSPDGNWAAWRSDRGGRTSDPRGIHDGVTFESTQNPDTRFTTALPAGTDVQAVTWESATDVLLRYKVRPGGTALRFLRCSVIEDRRCELVPTQADP